MDEFNPYDPELAQQITEHAQRLLDGLLKSSHLQSNSPVQQWFEANPQLPFNDFWNPK